MSNGSNQYRALTWLWIWIWWPEVHLLCLENENSALAPSHFLLSSTPSGLVVTKQIGREEGTACEKLWTWRTDHKLQPDGQCCVWRDFLASAEMNLNTMILIQPTCLCEQTLYPLWWVVGGVNFFPEREKMSNPGIWVYWPWIWKQGEILDWGISRHNRDTRKACSRVFVSLSGACTSDPGMLVGWSSWLWYWRPLVLMIWTLLSIISLGSAGCSDKVVVKG